MHASNPIRRPPVAIVGVSALFPGSLGAGAFWRNILDGTDLISDVPPSAWRIEDYYDPDPSAPDKTYAKRGGFLPPVPFDPLGFGIPPATLPATDTAQLLALIVARQVLEDASRGQFREVDRRRISVILGVASATELVVELGSRIQRPIWANAMRAAGLAEAQVQDICNRIANHYVPWQEASFPGLLGNVVAGRIANRLDLGGTNAVTDAACASSFAALEMGLNELYLGQSDLVIAGGVDAINDIFMYMCFSKTPALSPTGDCRPFSDQADGTLLGEGIGMFALRRLEDAERDGNPIYAVIRGLGASSDGRATSIYGPKPEGQMLALSRAYEAAGYSPATVEMVEAHGTGTKAGDLAEVSALGRVFTEADADRRGWCAVGSVKSQIGHTKAAAGAAGLFKAVMALHHKVLPPTIKVQRPAAGLDGATGPFYVNTRARPWISSGDHPRRASVSSFGFGGSNFHVTLEEYEGEGRVAARLPMSPSALFLVSAPTRADLAGQARLLANTSAEGFSTKARATQIGFAPAGAVRAAIVADSAADLAATALRFADALSSGGAVSVPRVAFAEGPATPGKLAFLFPGQGSQYVGMGADVAMAFTGARKVWDAASEPGDDHAVHRAVFPPPAFSTERERGQAEQLTAIAQPAIAAVCLSHLALLGEVGVRPDYTAGHSFGEVLALHAAGVFDAAATLAIARKRSDVMRAAAGTAGGAMSAIAAGRRTVEDLLAKWELALVVANDNAPDQVVVSGATDLVAAAERRFGEAGIRAVRLPVAAAFHSSFVSAATAPLAVFLASQRIHAPKIPVIGTGSAVAYPSEPDAIRATLAAQLAKPVRFREQVEALHAAGVQTFVEVGPGSVLTGLVQRTLAEGSIHALAMDRKGRNGTASLWEVLGTLAVLGHKVEFAPLWADVRVDEPAAAPTPGTVMLLGSNFGKPYPAEIAVAQPVTAAAPALTPVAGAAPPTFAPAASDERLAAFTAFQDQIAVSQKAFQAALSDSHRAFLDTAQKALEAFSGAPRPVTVERPVAPAAPTPTAPLPAVAAQVMKPPVSPVVVQRPAPVVAPAVVDPAGLLLSIVAEKTGYPPEMLNLSMSLESDLGVDSIKQVEILGALRERAPGLPEVEPADLTRLRTLGAIVEFLGAVAAPGPLAGSAPVPPAVAVAPTVDIGGLLLSIVAEKTGYPMEMLNLSMSLESDLGIDSIKQVEILGALRDRAPSLPEVEPSDLTRLRTVGAIVGFLRGEGAAPVVAPLRSATAPVQRSVVRLRAAPRVGALAGLPRTITIVPDHGGVGRALAALMRADGLDANVADMLPLGANGVVLLSGLNSSAPAETMSFHRDALMVAKAAAPGMAGGGLFVTVQDTGGAFGLACGAGDRAWAGGLPGLVKCAAHEWPSARVLAIDIAAGGRSPEAVARALYDELRHDGREREVALAADGARSTLEDHRESATGAVSPITTSSVIVVSGGARGVTAAATIALAHAAHPKLVLLGRTPLTTEPETCRTAVDVAAVQQALAGAGQSPKQVRARADQIMAQREIRATMRAIEAAGSPVQYVAVDVQDATALAAELSRVRAAWGPITGLIHGAGVIADKRIADKTAAQFDSVFGTKVVGLQALLGALSGDPLAVLCLFSSVAARAGNAGQSDYAMANAVLTQVAHAEAQRRGPACVVKAIHWGPWAGGMVTEALAKRFAAAGVPLIPLAGGAEFLVRELGDRSGAVEVVAGSMMPEPERTGVQFAGAA